MPENAKVTSLEAIEHFRAKLIVYRDKSGRVLDEVGDEVTRARSWLDTERPAFWQAQIRRLSRELEQAQQELFSAQLSGLRDASFSQQANVQKARRAIGDAEDKAKMISQWQRQFDQRLESPARQVEKLRHLLGHELGMAIAWLNEMTKTLTAYAEMSPSPAATKAPPADESASGESSS